MQRMIKAREHPAVILGSGCMLPKYWVREHVYRKFNIRRVKETVPFNVVDDCAELTSWEYWNRLS
jgi:hypothetical protein